LDYFSFQVNLSVYRLLHRSERCVVSLNGDYEFDPGDFDSLVRIVRFLDALEK
jgi:hypothetical protein